MIARIKAILSHLKRSLGPENYLLKEEEFGLHKDELKFYQQPIKPKSLMDRAKKSCKTPEEIQYFDENLK